MRKSIRNTALPGNSEPPSAPDVNMENVVGGKTLRQRKSVSVAPVNLQTPPRRKSVRVQNSIPDLYKDDSSEDLFTPSPVKKEPPAKRAIPVKSTKEIASPAVKLKKPKKTDDEDAIVEEKTKTPSGAKEKKSKKTEQTEQEKGTENRRSTRTPKPVQRLANEGVQNLTANPKISKGETPVAAITSNSATTNKLTRGRPRKRQESGNAAEVSLSKTPKKDVVQEATTDDIVGTPRSSKRNAAKKLDQKDTNTPVKPVAVATVSNPPQVGSSSKGPAQGKKLEWKFNIYGIPKCPLPCRENQFEEIWKFLYENVTEKNSGCMYVSGVPGTGKTVIVQAVIDTMGKVNDKEKNLNFKVKLFGSKTLCISLRKLDFIVIYFGIFLISSICTSTVLP